MKLRTTIISAIILVSAGIGLSPIASAEPDALYANVKKSTVLIVSYDSEGDPLGRGSGFYIDEGIIITNIHVIYGEARFYRIFIAGENDAFSPTCYKDITRSDIKLNLEDDVAYMRVYIDCPHGSVYFADSDPAVGEEIGILGFPALGNSFFSTPSLHHTSGSVLRTGVEAKIGERTVGPWIETDAPIHSGNSGGPVVQNGMVVGIAVASFVDKEGNSVRGLFIPVSVIRNGLEYANNSTFGYTPQELQDNEVYQEIHEYDPLNPTPTKRRSSDIDCKKSLGEGGQATGYTTKAQGNSCRCKPSYHMNDERNECLPGSPEYIARIAVEQQQTRATRTRTVQFVRQTPQKNANKMYNRVCPRVLRRFRDNEKLWTRVNNRISRRFGFVCSK